MDSPSGADFANPYEAEALRRAMRLELGGASVPFAPAGDLTDGSG